MPTYGERSRSRLLLAGELQNFMRGDGEISSARHLFHLQGSISWHSVFQPKADRLARPQPEARGHGGAPAHSLNEPHRRVIRSGRHALHDSK